MCLPHVILSGAKNLALMNATQLTFVILSEAKNLALFLFLKSQCEILRFAQNDRLRDSSFTSFRTAFRSSE